MRKKCCNPGWQRYGIDPVGIVTAGGRHYPARKQEFQSLSTLFVEQTGCKSHQQAMFTGHRLYFFPIEVASMLKQTISLLSALALAMSPMVSSSPAFSQGETKSNQFWWPEQLDLGPLRDHDAKSNPYGEDFNYTEAFE